MKKRLAILISSGVLASSAGASAQVPPSVPPSTTLRVNGIIDKYDPSTRTLSLSTQTGSARFTLASTTRIRQGWRKIDDADLKNLAGHHAVVRYSELSGHQTVESVRVSTQPR